jgi:hypothetical protein
MPLGREARTYRVRQLPPFMVKNHLSGFLAASCRQLGPAENIRVFSLASSLSQYETKTATLIFLRTPNRFDNNETQWTVACEDSNWHRNLIFDVHFIGLTPLNDRISDENPLE